MSNTEDRKRELIKREKQVEGGYASRMTHAEMIEQAAITGILANSNIDPFNSDPLEIVRAAKVIANAAIRYEPETIREIENKKST